MKGGGAVQPVKIHTEYITLGQLLKHIGLAQSGGEVKALIQTTTIHVDNHQENRRGRKLYPGTVVAIDTVGTYRIEADET